jgi:hypothetical protein
MNGDLRDENKWHESPKRLPCLKLGSYDFDSTCRKADIHFPIDRVLLRDAARTLMKASTLIRKHGLKNRMPQEPLEFLSDMNTLCMKMTAKGRAADSSKQCKKVRREMKTLEKRIAGHATSHLQALKTRRHESDLSEAQAQQIIDRMENVLHQLPAAVKQAHERMIGGRQVANGEKILSFYDDSINVIKRGKAGVPVEFGNKLWPVPLARRLPSNWRKPCRRKVRSGFSFPIVVLRLPASRGGSGSAQDVLGTRRAPLFRPSRKSSSSSVPACSLIAGWWRPFQATDDPSAH